MKNNSIILYIFLLVTSIPLALGCSRVIDALYAQKHAILTYPERLGDNERRRLFLLAVSIFICGRILLHRTADATSLFLALAAFLLLMMTATDFEQHLIFNETTAALSLLGLVHAGYLAWNAGTPSVLFVRLFAALAAGVVFFLLALLTRGGIGGGDVKLMAALGLWLGPDRLLTVSAVGFVLGGLAAFFLLVVKKKSRKATFAYGPYFTLTALVVLLTGG